MGETQEDLRRGSHLERWLFCQLKVIAQHGRRAGFCREWQC
jgi:hypothetical protein